MNKTKLILPALRGVIGDWVFYSSLMTAIQIKDRVKPAKDIREAKSLDEHLQRDLSARKEAIAKYLLSNDSRFFNSIIIGVFEGVPDWFEFKFNASPIFNFSEQDLVTVKDSIGFLVLNGDEQMFAIDGQHRVAGIGIAVTEDLKKDKDDQIIRDDQYSVIFVAHIDDELGKKRTRKLFSDINKNAKPVAEGDKLKIDEEDLHAIVTRRVYANYKYFNQGSLISLTESAKLDNNDFEHFTNLLGLNTVNKSLRKLFKKEKNTKDWEEINVKNFYAIVESFYNTIIPNIDEYKAFFIKKSLSLQKAREENKYLLFRPIGLNLIAKIYVYYMKKYPKVGSDKFVEAINKISYIFPDSPFNKILWNNGKMEAKSVNQNLSFDIALYMLRELPRDEKADLLKRYKETLKNESAKLPNQV